MISRIFVFVFVIVVGCLLLFISFLFLTPPPFQTPPSLTLASHRALLPKHPLLRNIMYVEARKLVKPLFENMLRVSFPLHICSTFASLYTLITQRSSFESNTDLLDHDNFSGVPATGLVVCSHPSFSSGSSFNDHLKIGSFQEFKGKVHKAVKEEKVGEVGGSEKNQKKKKKAKKLGR